LNQQPIGNFGVPTNLPYNMMGMIPDMSGISNPLGIGMQPKM